jgi:lambda repressor-like predicted transcriptional regulator
MKNITPAAAKVELKKRGHSCRSAAKHIGRSYQWINQVLNGRTTSRPVLRAIFDLPVREKRKQVV